MNLLDQNNELISSFCTECSQMLEQFDKLLLLSDQGGALSDSAELFRILHTLKGTSAMMEYAPLVESAHAFEDILAVLKASAEPLCGDPLRSVVDVGLEFSTYFHVQLVNLGNSVAPTRDDRLRASIARLAAMLGVSSRSAAPAASALERRGSNDGLLWLLVKLKKCPLPNLRASLVAQSASKLCTRLSTNPENLKQAAQYSEAIQNNGFEIGFLPLPPASIEDIIAKITAQPFVISCQLQKQVEAPPKEQVQTITVAQPLINSLMEYLGEIVTAESAVEAYVQEKSFNTERLFKLLSVLRRTIAEANVISAQIGMQDIGGVFLHMQRAIRNLAKDQGKQIKVAVIGSEIQVDKSILDILSDSLIHMVRNAADHGIELPEVRQALGKPTEGHITLCAMKKNDYLTVTVTDDGGGINRCALLEKAEREGKLTKPKSQYTDKEVDSLLLHAAVSTKTEVSKYSGRGVGLDTVSRRVRQAGGRISVDSTQGKGTTFTLHIPISLLVIDGVAVTLPDGSELIIPANAIRRIAVTATASAQYIYRDKLFYPLLFPGQADGSIAGTGYALLLEQDFGSYYIFAKKVSMLSCYYVKQLPEFIADAMGADYIYSGCIIDADAKLRCVLDVARLIRTFEDGKLSERQKGYEIHQ